MLVEFYVAARLGRVWLRLHPALKQRLGDAPDVCLIAAVNREINPAALCRAQEFAVRVWWRTAMELKFPQVPGGSNSCSCSMVSDLAIGASIRDSSGKGLRY